MDRVTHRSLQLGPWSVGDRPLVVGTLSTRDGLLHAAELPERACHVAEVRLDLIGEDFLGWMGYCEELQAIEVPVLLTLRHQAEGGQWAGVPARRLQMLERALPAISAFDVEVRQPDIEGAARLAADMGMLMVGSYHDFEGTPSSEVLAGWVEDALELGVNVVKIATWVHAPEEEERLHELLASTAEKGRLCVLAMGADAPAARVRLVASGSCLTYGYLDQPVAPGQSHARELWAALGGADAC